MTVAAAGAVAGRIPEQGGGAAFCDASAGKGKLVISVYTDAWAVATMSWATSS